MPIKSRFKKNKAKKVEEANVEEIEEEIKKVSSVDENDFIKREDRKRKNPFKYNPDIKYVGDIEYPTLWQRNLAFTEDPFWYVTIWFVIVFLVIAHSLEKAEPTDSYTADFTVIFFMNILYGLDIIVGFFTQHIIHLNLNVPNPVYRPIWMYVIEVVALFPTRYLIDLDDYRNAEGYYISNALNLLILVQAKGSLLLIRLVYEFFKRTMFFEIPLKTRIVEFIITGICIRLWAVYFYTYLETPKKEPITGELLYVLQIRARDFVYPDWRWYVGPILGILPYDQLFLIPGVCFIMIIHSMNNHAKYTYITYVAFFQSILKPRFKISEKNSDKVIEALNNVWNRREDHMLMYAAQNENILCKSAITFMNQDRNIQALQHSPMLRNLGPVCLRFLSKIIKPEIYSQGTYLYKFPIRKIMMVYISRGEVDILSSEDGEAPIIRLVAGTCVGSFCLIYPYRSNCSFRTGSKCELYIMTTKDFCELARDFPEEYRQCKKFMNKKIKRAIVLRRCKMQKNPEAIDMTIVWLKNTLHRLMSKTASNPSDHFFTNIYLLKRMATTALNDSLFTKANLDCLSILPRSSQNTDLVFIKSSCLWILQPNSPILKLLDKIMVAASIGTYCSLVYDTILGFHGGLFMVHIMGLVCMITNTILLCMTPLTVYSSRERFDIIAAHCFNMGFLCDLFSIIMSVVCIIHRFPELLWIFPMAGLRLWRVINVLTYLDEEAIYNIYVKKVLFYIGFYIFFWYNIGLVTIIFPERSEDKRIFKMEALISALFINFIVPNVFQTIIVCLIANTYYMKNHHLMEITNTIQTIRKCIKTATTKKGNRTLSERLNSFLYLLINDHEYLNINTTQQLFMKFPDFVEVLIKPARIQQYMDQSNFFSLFPIQMRKELVATAKVETFANNAVITMRGGKTSNIYFLLEGVVCSIELGTAKRVSIGSDLNSLEVICGMPVARTFLAFSNVITAAIPLITFQQALIKYPIAHEVFHKTLDSLEFEIVDQLQKLIHGIPKVIYEVGESRRIQTFYTYKCVMYVDSYEAYEFFPPFDKLGLLSWVRFLLLRITFHPEGWFYLWWEKFRILSACVGVLFYVVPNVVIRGIENYIFLFDVIGYVDIYLRMHLCYYNDIGIMVKHPLKTATRYLRNAFFIDFLSVIPLQFYGTSTIYLMVVRWLRILQLYRVIGYVHYKFTRNYIYIVIEIMYCNALIILTISTLMFECACPDSTVDNLNCPNFESDDPIQEYYKILMIITSSLLGLLMNPNVTASQLPVYCGTILIGIIWRAFSLGRLLVVYMTQHYNETLYRADIRKLLNVIKHNSLPTFLYDHVADFFEVHLRWTKEFNSEITKTMNPFLQRTFMFHNYGEPFIKYNMFTTDYHNLADFYKNIMIQSKVIICTTFGKFITANDVNTKVFLLHQGIVDIYDKEGVKIITLLAGSWFGNLTSKTPTKFPYAAISRCNTQCLQLDSNALQNIIEDYPEIKEHFVNAIKDLTYIRSFVGNPRVKVTLTGKQHKFLKAIEYFLLFHLMFICYFGTILNIYQIGTGQTHFMCISILYLMDIIHVITEFVRPSKPIKNNMGFWYFSFDEIVKINGKKKPVFIAVVTSIPLDLIIYINAPFNNWRYVYSIFRLNRLFRYYYIIERNWKVSDKCYCTKDLVFKFIAIIYDVNCLGFVIAAVSFMFEEDLNSDKDKTYLYFQHLLKATLKVVMIEDIDLHYPMLDTFLLNFCYMFRLYFICQVYDVLYDVYNRTNFIGTILFCKRLGKSKLYSDVIKQMIIRNARFVFSNEQDSLRILDRANCPIYIKDIILNALYGQYIVKHPMFRFTHIDFCRQVCSKLKVVDIPAGMEIIQKFDTRRCMFFLVKGCVVALKEVDDIINNYKYMLKPGDSFCELLGINKMKRSQYTFVCMQESKILELEYDSWAYLLDFFPYTWKIIEQIAEQIKDQPFLTLPIVKLTGDIQSGTKKKN